ncbi:EmrB/QacA subfamily drug resistance transporter [Streptacidiphilus sp. MAP12-20]|uniref:MFS transporter n=1 Tax=Streptacidiphilus sp. MAP12-20 TaxID=3156299 RepID=UPI003518C984
MSENTLVSPASSSAPADLEPAVQPPPPTHHRLALAVILTCQLMVILDATVVSIALPGIQHALGFSSAGLSWVMNIYSLTFGGLLLLGGRAGDIFGRRRLLASGIALFTLASLAGGLATTPTELLLARVAQGVGAAVAAPSTLALIVATFQDATERARAIGLFSAMSAGGATVGLILGGLLTSWLNWRWVMFINVPFGLVVTVLAPRVIQEPPRQGGRLDLAGALTATGGMVALVYGFIRAATVGWTTPLTLGCFAAAVLLLTAFVLVERRVAQPLLPLSLLTDRVRAGGYAAMLLVAAAMFGMFFFITQYLQNGLGLSPMQAGFAFLPLAVPIFAGARLAPRLVPRYGARPFLLGAPLLLLTGLLLLTRVDAHTTYAAGILPSMLLFGLGAGFTMVPLSLTILSSVRPQESGAASGTLQTMQQAGGALGTAVGITAFTTATRHPSGTGQAGLHATLAHGVSTAMACSAGLAVVAFVVLAVLVRPSRPARPGAPASVAGSA